MLRLHIVKENCIYISWDVNILAETINRQYVICSTFRVHITWTNTSSHWNRRLA